MKGKRERDVGESLNRMVQRSRLTAAVNQLVLYTDPCYSRRAVNSTRAVCRRLYGHPL